MSLDFFFWKGEDYIKDRIFSSFIADVKELKARIQSVVSLRNHIKTYLVELEYCLDVLRATKENPLKFTEMKNENVLQKIKTAFTMHPNKYMPFYNTLYNKKIDAPRRNCPIKTKIGG